MDNPNTKSTMKHTKTNNGIKPPRNRRAYQPNRFTQDGVVINLTVTAPKRIAELVKTEAAINNKSVSATLLDILEQRYRLVD